MKHLCYLGILKEGFSPYSCPIMLISRKVTQDKGVVIDFRHLNVRIAKNNLAYPLVRDAFSVLGNSKCEVLSVLDIKDVFHLAKTFGRIRKILQYITIFWKCLIIYQRMPMGLNISPSIWQSYINAFLECLQSRKHCKAVMDNYITVQTFKRAYMAKLEDLLKALLKNGLKYFQ